ncbi:MAG: hypothetical protein ACRDGQ_10905 [Candidatus Limnocylindrales bacterium]
MSDTTDQVIAIEKGFWTHADDPGYFEGNMVDGGLSVIEPMGFLEREQVSSRQCSTPPSRPGRTSR